MKIDWQIIDFHGFFFDIVKSERTAADSFTKKRNYSIIGI